LNLKSWVFDSADNIHADTPEEFAPQPCADLLNYYIDLWASAEDMGFEGLFFSEHHFRGGMSPSPNLFVAAMAMRTRRMRLGVLAQVLPMYPAWRVAEECAMLDHLTGGRLEIGVARGLGFIDTDTIGMSREEAKVRFEEALQILELGLTQTRFSFHGQYNNLDNLSITPRPLQQPRPPIWQTVRSPESARSAGLHGYKICGAYDLPEHIAGVFDAFRAGAQEAGRTVGPDDMGLRRHIFVDHDEARAKAFATETLQKECLKYGGPNSPPGRMLLSGEDVIAGTPQQVAELILEQGRITGAGHMLMMMVPAASLERMVASYELYGAEVIPLLQAEAGVNAPKALSPAL
jgi:alkanesulfonate monooxygenase SsuD/methylene tetrahydromethanopterin reductase-like flavin-dependent oxidoreductase (luciferase family)